MKIAVRFTKIDKFKHAVFSYDKSNDKGFYKLLKAMSKKWAKTYKKSLPVWIDREKKYGTIKFKASLNGFKVGSTYEITFSCFENEKDNEKYLSLIIDLSKHIKDKSMGKSVNIPDLKGSDLEDSDNDE